MDNNFEQVLSLYDGAVTLIFDPGLHAYYEVVDGVKYLVPGSSTVTGIIDKSGPLTQWAANMTVQWLREKLALPEYVGGELMGGLTVIKTDELETLFQDARFNFKSIKKAAADIGTEAHKWLQECAEYMIASGQPAPDPETAKLPEEPRAASCVTAALRWMKIHDFKPTKAENKIFSRQYGYGGTFDWTGWVTSCGDPKCCPFQGTKFALGDYKSSNRIYEEYRAQTASYQEAYNEESIEIGRTPVVEIRIILRLGKEDGEFEPLVLMPEDFERDIDGYLGALQVYNWIKQFALDKKAEKQAARAAKKPAKPRKIKRPVAPGGGDEMIPIDGQEKAA